jgi:hypothetical protein
VPALAGYFAETNSPVPALGAVSVPTWLAPRA